MGKISIKTLKIWKVLVIAVLYNIAMLVAIYQWMPERTVLNRDDVWYVFFMLTNAFLVMILAFASDWIFVEQPKKLRTLKASKESDTEKEDEA